jgi:hypothetical protein
MNEVPSCDRNLSKHSLTIKGVHELTMHCQLFEYLSGRSVRVKKPHILVKFEGIPIN